MNKLFAIGLGILALTSTVKAVDFDLQQTSYHEKLSSVSGSSFKSYEDASNKAYKNIPNGYVMASVQYGKNGSEYIVIIRIKKG